MNTETLPNTDESPRSAQIESEIEMSRRRMDATLDELGNRLTPQSMIKAAYEWWQSHDTDGGGNPATKVLLGIVGHAKQHPMPSLLIGTGVVWLLADHAEDGKPPGNGGNRHRSTYAGLSGGDADRGDAGQSAEDGPGSREHGVLDKLHESKDALSEKAHHVLDKGANALATVKHKAHTGYEAGLRRADQAFHEHPLAVGAGFAALGVLAGLIVPRTAPEDRYMGEKSDELLEETREKAKALFETGKAAAGEAVQTVKEELKNKGIDEDTVASKLKALAADGGEILHKAKDEAVRVAEERGFPASKPEDQCGSPAAP